MKSFEEMKALARGNGRAHGHFAQTIGGQSLEARWNPFTKTFHYSYDKSGPCSISPDRVREIIAGAARYPSLVAAPANHGDLALQLCEARRLQREGCDTTATQAAIVEAYQQVA